MTLTPIKVREDLYNHALYWIIRERAGAGGWPPRDVAKVSGWTVVRLVASVHGRPVNAVAKDLIERYELHEEC